MENVQGKPSASRQGTGPVLTKSSYSDWAAYLMENHNVPNVPISYYGYARQAYSYLYAAQSRIRPLIDQVSQKPDLATLALLLIVLFISLKILNMLYQTVVFWLRMAWRLVFWGGLISLGLWMYTRGPEGVTEDLQHWYQTWNGEYQHWTEQERLARSMQEQMQQQMGGGRGQQRWY
jgi:hypothetical protein